MGPRVVRVIQNIVALFRTRVEVATHEARAAARHLIVGIVYAGIAAVLLVIAIPMAVVTLVLLLRTALPTWAATAIVFAVLVLLAGGLMLAARRKFSQRRLGGFLNGLREDWKTIRERLEG